MNQAGGGSFGFPAGGEERAKAAPLLYFFSHGCSEPAGHGVTSGAWLRKTWLWLEGDSAQDFPMEEAGLRGRMPNASGEKLCRVSVLSVAAFSQMPGQLPIQLADCLAFQN